MSSQIDIAVEHFSLSLGGKKILNEVSFVVGEGEFVVVLGPNGAGKTSLLRAMLGLVSGEGSLRLSGKEVESMSRRDIARHVAYVPQQLSLFFPMSVRDFVMTGLYAYRGRMGRLTTEAVDASNWAMECTDSLHLASRPIGNLSGGERQRVMVASALAQRAPLLLLDEPSTFLDPKHEQELFCLLSNLSKDCGLTVIAVTHNINRALLSKSRVLALKNGSLFYSGNAERIREERILEDLFETEFVFVEHPITKQPMVLPLSE